LIDNNIFVSTAVFQSDDFRSVIDICQNYSLKNLELGFLAGLNGNDLRKLGELRTDSDFHFLIHNYFPPPPEPFVLNLADYNEPSWSLSIDHCKKAIDLASALQCPFYSLHAGFCFRAAPAHLGRKITAVSLIPKEEARRVFIHSLQLVADYARKKNVRIAIENHVVEADNRVNGENPYFLGVTADDLLELVADVQRENVGVLLDLGHLKVSANTLGFSPEEFIEKLSPKIIAIHFHDNNGIKDEHSGIAGDSWFWKPIRENLPGDLYGILEVEHLDPEEITRQVRLISSLYYNYGKDHEI
jgi:sugar phosphate isomerase/epimerase